MSTASREDYRKAREAVEHALQIDGTLAEAHRANAWMLGFCDHDWLAAEKEYARAKELDSVSELGTQFLNWMSRQDDARDVLRQRLQLIDPLSTRQNVGSGWEFFWIRQYDKAIEQARKALELEPELRPPQFILAFCYEQMGMREKAFEAYLQCYGIPEEKEAARTAYQKEGLKGYHRWRLAGIIKEQRPYEIAVCYAQIGDKDKAFRWLEKAYKLPIYASFFTDWRFDSLRSDPRFEQLLRKLNLPEEAIQRHLALR